MDAKNYIPHQEPMQLVHTILAVDDESIITNLKVNKDTYLLDGNLLSEAGLIEHMAQSVAAHTGKINADNHSEPKIGYIGSITEFEIFKLPKIGDELKTKVTIINEYMGMTKVEIASEVNESIIAIATMNTVIS